MNQLTNAVSTIGADPMGALWPEHPQRLPSIHVCQPTLVINLQIPLPATYQFIAL